LQKRKDRLTPCSFHKLQVWLQLLCRTTMSRKGNSLLQGEAVWLEKPIWTMMKTFSMIKEASELKSTNNKKWWITSTTNVKTTTCSSTTSMHTSVSPRVETMAATVVWKDTKNLPSITTLLSVHTRELPCKLRAVKTYAKGKYSLLHQLKVENPFRNWLNNHSTKNRWMKSYRLCCGGTQTLKALAPSKHRSITWIQMPFLCLQPRCRMAVSLLRTDTNSHQLCIYNLKTWSDKLR